MKVNHLRPGRDLNGPRMLHSDRNYQMLALLRAPRGMHVAQLKDEIRLTSLASCAG